MNLETRLFSNDIIKDSQMKATDKNHNVLIPKPNSKSRHLKVIVTGGSLGGLCAGLALRNNNCDVEIFEKSFIEMKSRGAGIVLQTQVIDFLKEHSMTNIERG